MTALHSVENPAPHNPAQLHVVEEPPTAKFHGSVRVAGVRERIDWTLEVPEDDLASNGIILQLPGYGGIKRSSRGERHAYAANGEASVTYDPARISGNWVENITQSQELHTRTAERVLESVHTRVKGSRDIPHAKFLDTRRVTLSPHSMGGFPATALALRHPESIEAIIYKAAAGFGTPSWRALWELDIPATIGEIDEFAHSDQIDRTLRNLWRIAYYYGRSPSRSLGEAFTCLTQTMVEDVVQVGEHDIPTAYLGFELDGLVPVKPVEPVAQKIVDIFRVMPGVGHLAPQRYPVETAAEASALRRQLTGN